MTPKERYEALLKMLDAVLQDQEKYDLGPDNLSEEEKDLLNAHIAFLKENYEL